MYPYIGGASMDPKINTKLRNVINDAKKINMPTDTINRVIQNYDVRLIYSYFESFKVFQIVT